MKMRTAVAGFFLIALCSTTALALTDDEIRQQIIHDSISQYMAAGRPCACPYNLSRNGSQCGARSAYSRPGGAEPLCYLADVTNEMITKWKAHNQ